MPKIIRDIIKASIIVLVLSVIMLLILAMCSAAKEPKQINTVKAAEAITTYKIINAERNKPETAAKPIEQEKPETAELYSTEEIELMALVTMAEAEGECEEGKRLVIDTILNRVDSEHFPDTVYDVIYQLYQFSCMWNGRVDRCEVREDICELVREEIDSRTNFECVFFNTGNYSKYGVPLFQVEHHYFSKYE